MLLLFCQAISFLVILGINIYLIKKDVSLFDKGYFSESFWQLFACIIFLSPTWGSILDSTYFNYSSLFQEWWKLGWWLFGLQRDVSGNWWSVIYYITIVPINFLVNLWFILQLLGVISYLISGFNYYLLGGKWKDLKFVDQELRKNVVNTYRKIHPNLFSDLNIQVAIFRSACAQKHYELIKEDWLRNEEFIQQVAKMYFPIELNDYIKCNEILSESKAFFYARGFSDHCSILPSKSLCDNKEFVLELIEKKIPHSFALFSDRLRNDYDVVKVAVERNYQNLEYASLDIKDNDEIAEYAIKINVDAIRYVSKRLQDSDEFVKLAISNGLNIDYKLRRPPWGFESVNYEQYPLFYSKAYMKYALALDGTLFIFLPDSLLQDIELFNIAFNNGLYNYYINKVIEHLCQPMYADYLESCGCSISNLKIQKISLDILRPHYRLTRSLLGVSRLISSKPFLLWVIRENLFYPYSDISCRYYIPALLLGDFDVLRLFVEKGYISGLLKYSVEQLKDKNFRDVIIDLINSGHTDLLRDNYEILKSYDDIGLSAIKQNSNNLLFTSDRLRGNLEFVMSIVKHNPDVIKFATNDVQEKIKLINNVGITL